MEFNVWSFIFGLVAGQIGLLLLLPLLRAAKDEQEDHKIERIDRTDAPVMRETRDVVQIYAETTVFEPCQPWETREALAEERLKKRLADQVWKYAFVTSSVDKKNFETTYRARLDVTSRGRCVNPLCEEWGRRMEEME